MDRIITLADHAKNQKNFSTVEEMGLAQLMTASLYDSGFPFVDMHVDTTPRLAQQFPVVTGKNLPTVDWVKINQDPTPSKGTMRLKTRHMYFLRAPIEIDNAIINDPDKIYDPWDMQIKLHLEAAAYSTKDAFFNGAPTVDDNAPVGLRYMARNPSYETGYDLDPLTLAKVGDNTGGNPYYCGSTSGIDLTSAGGAAAGVLAVAAFRQAFRRVGSPNGDGCVIFGSGTANILLSSRIQQNNGGGFTTSKDGYDRMVDRIAGAKLRDAGFKRNATTLEETDEQIPLVQTVSGSADTGSTYTSFLVVNMNKNKFRAWQPRALALEKRPDTDFGKKGVIDWGFGLAEFSTRAFVEIAGFKVA